MKTLNTRNRKLLLSALASTALAATPALAGDDGKAWEGELKDAWLDGKIETSYALSQYLNPLNIETDVEKGVVMLSGTVESEIDKELAEEIALGTEGVTKVVNQLSVAQDGEPDLVTQAERTADDFQQRFSDATTTARVKFALLANDSTDALDIEVDTAQGVVTLSGEVGSEQTMALAERIAENAEGVRSVENELKVASSS